MQALPGQRTTDRGERSRYREVAEWVRRTSLRCEGCGARLEDDQAGAHVGTHPPRLALERVLCGYVARPRPFLGTLGAIVRA